MSEYLERRDLLQTAEEQQRRLHEVPKVIADEIEVKATTLDLPVIMNQEDDISPQSTLSEASEVPFCHTAAKKTSSTWISFGTKSADGGNARVEEQQKIPTSIQSKSRGRPPAAKIEEKKLSQVVIHPPVLDSRNEALVREQQKQHPTSIQGGMSSNGGMSPAGTEENKSSGRPPAAVIEEKNLLHAVINPPILNSRNDALVREQQKQYQTSIQSWMSSNSGISPAGTEVNKSSGRPPAAVMEEKNLLHAVINPPILNSRNDALVREQQNQHPTSIQGRMSCNGTMPHPGTQENKLSQPMMAAAAAASVIDLSDDEEDEDPVQILEYDPVNHIWHYMDPQGEVQGPFSITSLKRWKDNAYFPPDFKVWKMGQSPAEAVLLNVILDKLCLS